MWIRVVDGELQDTTRSDLYEYVVDFLSFCTNLDFVWKYADWALKKDPTVCNSHVILNHAPKVREIDFIISIISPL